jgi:hypothetical protein
LGSRRRRSLNREGKDGEDEEGGLGEHHFE